MKNDGLSPWCVINKCIRGNSETILSHACLYAPILCLQISEITPVSHNWRTSSYSVRNQGMS